MRSKTRSAAAGALCVGTMAAILAAPAASAGGRDVLPMHLAALRLHGPVLIEGQTGAPLEERMRELHVPGVSVALCGDGEIRWAEAWGTSLLESRSGGGSTGEMERRAWRGCRRTAPVRATYGAWRWHIARSLYSHLL